MSFLGETKRRGRRLGLLLPRSNGTFYGEVKKKKSNAVVLIYFRV